VNEGSAPVLKWFTKGFLFKIILPPLFLNGADIVIENPVRGAKIACFNDVEKSSHSRQGGGQCRKTGNRGDDFMRGFTGKPELFQREGYRVGYLNSSIIKRERYFAPLSINRKK